MSNTIEILVLSQNRFKNWFNFMAIPLFLGMTGAFTVIIPSVIEKDLGLGLFFIANDIIVLFVSLLYIALLWPGQGDLILSPEGFEVVVWPSFLGMKYTWDEVGIFQAAFISVGKGFAKRVGFDVNRDGKKKTKFLRFHYDPSLEEMADLMNEWKVRF